MNVEITELTFAVRAMVESEKTPSTFYEVMYQDGRWSCSHPYSAIQPMPCKHCKALLAKLVEGLSQ